jgi:hypothetical protein
MSAMDEQTWEGDQEYSMNGVNKMGRGSEKLRGFKGRMATIAVQRKVRDMDRPGWLDVFGET